MTYLLASREAEIDVVLWLIFSTVRERDGWEERQRMRWARKEASINEREEEDGVIEIVTRELWHVYSEEDCFFCLVQSWYRR